LLRRALLREKPRGSGAKGPDGVLVLGKDGQDEDPGTGSLLAQLAYQLEPTAARHVDVENDHVPALFSREIADLVNRRRLAADEDVGRLGQDLTQPSTDDGVLIGDEDLDHCAPGPNGSGTRSATRVPCGVAASTTREPPKRCARSRIPRRPSDLRLCAASTVMPVPSSRASSDSAASSIAIVTSTRLAAA